LGEYLNAGLDSLVEKRRSGRPPALTDAQLKQLKRHISQAAKCPDGGRLLTIDIQRYITNHFDVDFKISNVYRLLHQLNFSWTTSRSKPPSNHLKSVKTLLKNFLLETIRHIPGHISLEQVDVWFQDEARFGQQNTTTRVWAEKGVEYTYLSGAVCSSTGQTEAIIAPWTNKEVMIEHLALISKATPPGRHAVIIMDGAGCGIRQTHRLNFPILR